MARSGFELAYLHTCQLGDVFRHRKVRTAARMCVVFRVCPEQLCCALARYGRPFSCTLSLLSLACEMRALLRDTCCSTVVYRCKFRRIWLRSSCYVGGCSFGDVWVAADLKLWSWLLENLRFPGEYWVRRPMSWLNFLWLLVIQNWRNAGLWEVKLFTARC